MSNGKMLVLEVKGRVDEQSKTKRKFLNEWVQAVNAHGGFGRWCADVSYSIGDLKGIIEKHTAIPLLVKMYAFDPPHHATT